MPEEVVCWCYGCETTIYGDTNTEWIFIEDYKGKKVTICESCNKEMEKV